jgi:salicylate biosynthesis isochorismate synthase
VSGHALVWRPLAREEAPDPLALLAVAPDDERFYLEQPARGRAIVAVGAAAELTGAGACRFTSAAEQARTARVSASGEAPPDAPLWLGGFAFRAGEAPPGSPWRRFGELRFVLPRVLLLRHGGRSWLAHAAPDAAEADALLLRALRASPLAPSAGGPRIVRPGGGYRRLVARALDAIAKGELDKVVAARSLALAGAVPPLGRLLAALRREQPAATLYAVAPGFASAAFLGATPERLARVSGRDVEAQALAGTAPAGGARALFASAKERAEHACVVADLAAALAPLCERVAHAATPRARAVGGLVHLETPVRARLAEDGLGLLDVAARLHPSAAVCGAPRAEASRWLAAHEGLVRGWYAGGVGWLDASGGGELFTALRCALLAPGRAELFAGAGIVAGSTPAAEQRETRLKLRALLRAVARA